MAYTLRKTNLDGVKENDFQFCVDGVECGRTYEQNTPIGINWYWSIYGGQYRGVIPSGVAVQGTAPSRDAACGAFKRNWEMLAAAGLTRPR